MIKGAFFLVVAVLRTIYTVAWVLPLSILNWLYSRSHPDWARPVDEKTKRVVVLLHGVSQKRAIWTTLVDRMLKELPKTDAIYAPFFDHREPLVALASHVLSEIIPFVDTRGLELVVVGYSNGGRIALHLEQMFSGHLFILVAAPVKGTKWLSVLPDAILKLRLDPRLIREMNVHRFIPNSQSRVICFAADYDEMVWPAHYCAPGSLLPYVLRGHTHSTIGFSPEVMNCIQKLKA